MEMASRQREVVLGHADGEAADQVDRGDDDGGDGVAADELRGPVHRSVEVGLVGHLLAPAPCLDLVDGSGVQVGVDGHLLARHAVEREASRDLGHPAGAGGDHDELNDDEDEEDDQPHEDGAADHEVAEALDHHAGVAVQEDEPRGGDVEGQAEHGGHQDERREDREVERALHLHGGEQDQDRPGDVGGDEEVDDEGGQRDDEHDDDRDDREGHGHGGHPSPALVLTRRRCRARRGSAMHVPRLVSKDGSHVRHPLPAARVTSVPGHIPAVLASHCSPYYGTAAGQSSGGRAQPPRLSRSAPKANGAIRCTSPSILAVGESE